MFEDNAADNIFRQKSPNSIPTGQEQQAVDANPSEESGTNPRIGTPVWRKFVANEDFQRSNKAAVAAENDSIRQAEASNRREESAANREIWKGGDGKLLRKFGRQTEILDPEQFTDHPVAGAEARKSLWDREVKTARKDASDSAFRLRDPAFQAKSLTDKQREEMLAEGDFLQETDARHAELKAKLKADDDYRAEKQQLAQRSWDSEARAREIEAMEPDAWFQNRRQPTEQERRGAAVAETQAKRAEASAAQNDGTAKLKEIDAKLLSGVKGTELQALQQERAEIAAGLGVIAESAAAAEAPVQAVKAEAQEKEKDFFRTGDAISGIWDAVKGLGVTAPAAFYQLVEGMERPDQYSDSAKAAFAEADAFNKEMQAKTEANQKAGTSSSVGESFREAGGSLGFSLGSMAAAIPASMAGAKAGAAAGGLVGGAIGAPAAGVGAAPGAVLGASIGGTVGGVGAGMAASGTAAYRMAGAAFLNESFAQIEAESMRKNGRPMSEEEKASAYEALLPIAKNTALWEAGPEAVGNAVTLGAGKIIFGLGKPLAAKFAKTVGGKVIAGAGSLATELGTETLTQVEQAADQQKATAIAQGQDPNAIQADWSAGGVVDSFKEVAPQTLALMGLMGGAGGALKIAAKATGIGNTPKNPDGTPDTASLKPDVDTALAAIDPELPAAEPAEIEKAMALVNPNEQASGLAEAVLIERELQAVSMQDDEAYAAAEEAVAAAKATGDAKQVKAAEEARDGVRGRAEGVRAVLKIAAGQQPGDLTAAELRSLGLGRGKSGNIDVLPDKELEAAGLDDSLVYPAEDGSLILTDEAIKRVRAVSPRAADRVKMDEATAIAKAKARVLAAAEAEAAAEAAKLSTTTPDGVQGDPATGSNATGSTAGAAGGSPAAGRSPYETEGGVETSFDVRMKSGAVIRVQASTAQEAESLAATSIPPFSDSVMPGQAVAVAPALTNPFASGVGPNPNAAPNVAPNVAPTPGQAAVAAARSHVAKIAKQSPEIAAALQTGPAEATATRISTDPEVMIAEAMSAGMTEKEALARFKASFDEEIKHFAQRRAALDLFVSLGSPGGDVQAWRDEHYGTRWLVEFSGEKAAVARTLYAKGNAAVEARWDAMPDADKFFEATRMMMQRREGSTVTEQSKLWANISKALADDLRAMLRALRAMVKNVNLSPALKADLEFFENELRNLLKQSSEPRESKPATESKPRPRSPKANPAQPAQGGKGAGDAAPAAQDGTGEAPNDGGTVPPRSEGARPPLAVGARVEFDAHDGRPAGTGIIRDLKGTAVSVKVGDESFLYPAAKVRSLEASADTKPAEEPAIVETAKKDSDEKATLTFTSREKATAFATAWGRYSTRGHDMGATSKDGITLVTVYKVSSQDKEWIDSYVANESAPAAKPEGEVDALAQIEAEYQSALRLADSWKASDPEKTAKQRKAAGMQRAAAIRNATGNLTGKERQAKDAREASNYVGKPVSVNGKNGKVTSVNFGKVSVKFADGTKKSFDPDLIQSPVEQAPAAETPTLSEADKALLEAMDGLFTAALPVSEMPSPPNDYAFLRAINRYEEAQGTKKRSENRDLFEKIFEEEEAVDQAYEKQLSEWLAEIPENKPISFVGTDGEGLPNYKTLTKNSTNKENPWRTTFWVTLRRPDWTLEEEIEYEDLFKKTRWHSNSAEFSKWNDRLNELGSRPTPAGSTRIVPYGHYEFKTRLEALRDAMTNNRKAQPEVGSLFTADLPDSFTAAVPPDRIGPLVTVATKYLAEGVNTPEMLAGRLNALAGGKMRQFSQSIWFAFKMAGTPGAAEPDWSGVYASLDTKPVIPAKPKERKYSINPAIDFLKDERDQRTNDERRSAWIDQQEDVTSARDIAFSDWEKLMIDVDRGRRGMTLEKATGMIRSAIKDEIIDSKVGERMIEKIQPAEPSVAAKKKRARKVTDTPARREAYRLLQSGKLLSIDKVIGQKIQSPPTGMLKILKNIQKNGSRKLKESERKLLEAWDGFDSYAPKYAFGSDFNGKVAQELHGMLFSQSSENTSLDDWAGLLGDKLKNDEAMILVMGELSQVSRGMENGIDPNRELSPTEESQMMAFGEANQWGIGNFDVFPQDFEIGNVLTIAGEEFTLISKRDGQAALEDGDRFGTQRVPLDASLWIDSHNTPFTAAEEAVAEGLVDEADSRGYDLDDEFRKAEPEEFARLAAEEFAAREAIDRAADEQVGGVLPDDSGAPKGGRSGENGGGNGLSRPPASKMDIRNADSRELFADDGGFQLGQDSTVDGAKVVAERKAKEDAKAAMDAAQGDMFGQSAPKQPEPIGEVPKHVAEAIAKDEQARIIGEINVDLHGEAAREWSYGKRSTDDLLQKARDLAKENGWKWEDILTQVKKQLGLNDDFGKEGDVAQKYLDIHRKRKAELDAKFGVFDETPATSQVKPELPEGVSQEIIDRMDRELERAQSRKDKLQAISDKMHEQSRNTPGSFTTGRSNQHKGLMKARDGMNDRLSKAFDLLQEAEAKLQDIQGRREGYASGERHENGQPRANSPSRKEAATAVDEYGDYLRATVKKGDRITFASNPAPGGSIVKSVNKKTITLEGGTSWSFDYFMPWKDGKEMTRGELSADLKTWREGPPATSPNDITSLETLRDFMMKLDEGIVTADDVKAAWESFKTNEMKVVADLAKLTMKQLERYQGMRRATSKADAVRMALDRLSLSFNPGESLAYQITGDAKSSYKAALDKAVATWTDQRIAERAQARKDRNEPAAAKEEEPAGPTMETLESMELVRQWGDKWQYKMRVGGTWYYADSKEGAIESAISAFNATPESERKTRKDTDAEADAKYDAESERLFAGKSKAELEKDLQIITRNIEGLQSAARMEFDGNGGRRTGAAVSAEGARTAGEHKMRLERYLREKFADNDDSSSYAPDTAVESTADIEQFSPEQAASELNKRGITLQKDTTKTGKTVWRITGKTFDVKDQLKTLGAKWYAPAKAWSIFSDEDPTTKIASALAGKPVEGEVSPRPQENSGTGGNADEDLRLRELRERLDSNPDERGTRGDAISSVDADTAALIRRGLKFGMPPSVVEDQIEDVAMITRAFTGEKPMFLLGNGAGTGKTFVLGGAIREMRSKGAKSFVYVTMNTDLIDQIKKDLEAFGIQDVQFHTYSEMSTKPINLPTGAVLIFDEAHNVKNEDSSRGGVAQGMMGRAKFTIFASATPFENPVEAGYVAGTGIFNQMGGHTEFAKAYGANVRKVKGYDQKTGKEVVKEYVYWTAGKLEDGMAARQWFTRQGIMITRPMQLPMEMVESQFSKHNVDQKWVDMHNKVEQAYDDAMAEFRDAEGNILDARNNAMVAMHMVNTVKRILEASKVDQAVKRAQSILNDGGNVVLFVETKADRWIGRYRASAIYDKKSPLYTYPQMRDMMREWEQEAAMARKMKERPGPRPFAEAIMSIARAMHSAGIEYELPSVEQELVERLGGKSKVGIYTGSVTAAAATKDKAAFLSGEKKVIVATMAKGGTGLSLHDRVGNRQTSQINLNLPWKASGVDQVSARVARYGLQSKAYIEWLFAENIPFERSLAYRVGRRMRDMGAIVKGVDMKAANVLADGFDFEGNVDVKQITGEVEIAETDIFDVAERLEKSRRQRGDQSNGFFETPFTLSALMTVVSGARGKLLEPSGGRGNLVRFAKDSKAVTSITIVEQRADNADYLEGTKNGKTTVIRGDFMDESAGLGKFDTIHMNPPFEREAGVGAQDVVHVMAAYDLLAPDGRLVAIMGEGAFFRSTKQEQEFRQWLDDNGAIVVKLPENAFKNSNTGVRARMVIIDQGSTDGRTDINLGDMDADSLRSVAEAIPARDTTLRTADLPTAQKFDIDSPRSLQIPLESWNEQRESQRSAAGNDPRIATSAIRSFRNALGPASNLRFLTLAERSSGQDGARGNRFRLSDSLVKTVSAFESAFGKRVVFFEADSYETPPPRGGLHPSLTPNYIAINADSPFSLPFVLGHELGHAIQRQQNGLYEDFKAKVLPLIKNRDGYISKEGLEKLYAGEKLDNEIFNDTLGHFFRDPALWNELAAKDARLTDKIGRAVVVMIDKMLRGLGSRIARDVGPNVADNLSAIRSHIADLLKQYRETGSFPAFTPTPQGVRESDGLLSSALPDSPVKKGRAAFEKNRALFENAQAQAAAFGGSTIGANPKFANPGLSPDAREPFDIARMIDSHQREVRKDRDTFARGREYLEKYPDAVEALLMENAYSDDTRAIDDYQQHAINLLLDRKAQEAAGDRAKMDDLYVIAAANIINGREQARAFRMRMDRFATPAERAQSQIADAIFSPSKKVAARAEVLAPKERKAFLAEEGKKRIAEVEKALAKLGVRLDQVLGKNRELQLVNSRIEKEMMKLRNTLEQDIIRFVQKGASMADIKRRFGKLGAEQAEGIIAKARQDLFDRIKALAASGMSQADIREAMKDSLKTSPLDSAANGMTDAEIWKMIDSDFGIPSTIPARPLPSVRPKKPVSEIETNPLSANWSRPEFSDGMNSYTFDTKDRAGIMERVEIIRGLAGALGKINGLTGDKLAKANANLAEINAILKKYGTDAAGIFEASKGIEDYGFDITDIAQVAAVARTINALDADIIDKASEYLYFSMLSGLQTMVVNATAIAPAAWESTVGRGVNMAINRFVNDPMAEQYGEGKYILKALAPALARAKSNFMASMAAQHPMFDRDVNAMEVDWDKILGGGSHRMIGSISGRKGDIIRLPMRLLTATDDFNRTLIACAEVGTFAYRMAKMRGYKDGSKEMDKFIREEVNTPGSLSYQMASQKASKAIYSNPLPGQKDPHTKKAVPVNDLGDVAGFLASKLTSAVTGDHDNIFVKAVSAALRIAFFPFQRTPFNIIRKGVRHTLNPFSLFDIALGVTRNAKNEQGKWEWAIKGDGQFAMDRMTHRAELIERFGQQLQGAILMTALIAVTAGEGDDDDQDKGFIITGSSPFLPTGMAERDARMRSGVGPFRFSWRNKDGSERVGFSYGRLEPVATILAATIDTVKSFKREMRGSGDTYNAAMAAMGGFVSQAQDKSFMKGIGDFIKLSSSVMAEPDLRENRKALQFLAGRAAMVVPNFIKQPIRESDGQFRDKSQGFMEELMYQMVPAGQKPAKLDPYGKALEKPGFAAGRIIDVADIGGDTVNPIDRMLLKWADRKPAEKWFPSPILNAEFKHPKTGQNVKMTGEQLQEFRELSGKRASALLKLQKVNMASPTAMDVEKVKEIISKSRSDMKKALAFKFSKQ